MLATWPSLASVQELGVVELRPRTCSSRVVDCQARKRERPRGRRSPSGIQRGPARRSSGAPGRGERPGGSGGRHWSSGPGLMCDSQSVFGDPCYGGRCDARPSRRSGSGLRIDGVASVALPGGSHLPPAGRVPAGGRACTLGPRRLLLDLLRRASSPALVLGVDRVRDHRRHRRAHPARSPTALRLFGQFGGWFVGADAREPAQGPDAPRRLRPHAPPARRCGSSWSGSAS